MKVKTTKASTYVVRIFNHHRYTFSVEKTMDQNEGSPKKYYQVELHRGWCECKEVSSLMFPCSHVITTCLSVHHDTSKDLSAFYKVVNIFSIYNNNFPVVAKEKYFPTYQVDVFWHNKNMRRKKKGYSNNLKEKHDYLKTFIRKHSYFEKNIYNYFKI